MKILMRIRSAPLFGVALILLFVSQLPAQNLRDPLFMQRAQGGFRDIMNLDYDEAQQVFASLEKDYPKHPAPPLYSASIFWLQEMLRRQDLSLNRFIAPTYFSKKTDQTMPPSKRAAFFQGLQRSEALISALLKKDPKDKDARYFLGTAYGLRSSFAITIDHSLSDAFSNGKKAYTCARQLINEDPGYYDAYMATGIYEYVVDSIPWYWKWMAVVIGLRGDKEVGMSQLKLACEKGQYVKNEAQLVLMVMNVREHRYNEARDLSQRLHSQFPKSFLFALSHAQVLRLAGNKEQAVAAFLEVEKKIAAREPNFDSIPLQEFRYNLGAEFMAMDIQDLAQERFQLCVNDPRTQPREKTLAHLNLGRTLYWKGELAEAGKEWQIVLSQQDVENSHDQARDLLKRLKRKR